MTRRVAGHAWYPGWGSNPYASRPRPTSGLNDLRTLASPSQSIQMSAWLCLYPANCHEHMTRSFVHIVRAPLRRFDSYRASDSSLPQFLSKGVHLV